MNPSEKPSSLKSIIRPETRIPLEMMLFQGAHLIEPEVGPSAYALPTLLLLGELMWNSAPLKKIDHIIKDRRKK